ncbi:TorF family putative porin [Aquabacterium sp.]|uniref:TorF family putative porin n=1 Tax=Aquabacterium sp. TaxID=1872578 RepID=UPI0035B0B405
MKKQAFALAALSLLSISAAYAEEAKPDWTLTGNAGLFSDYRFRGYTQTAYKPAFQGGFDLAHSSGFYVGNWNSNVEQALYRGASLEMDFYGGYKFNAGPVALDAGAYYYYYPSSNHGFMNAAGKQAHQDEIYIGASYSFFTAKLSYGLSNFFGLGDATATTPEVKTDGNYYLDLGFAYDLGQGYGINAHYGYQKVPHGKDAGLVANNASDYKLGMTKDFSGWVAGASLISTSKKDWFTTGVSPTRGAGKTGLVLSLSKTF